jgi:hypothetical protein
MAVLLSSCDTIAGGVVGIDGGTVQNLPAPPYVITKPVFEITERTGYFHYAGLVFNFKNTAAKQADKITVSFTLFDPVTQRSPFIGSNMFKITRLIEVLSGENKEIIISLDQYIYIAPDEPYLIDSFYIAAIHYTDGSNWEDTNGLYRVQE